MTSLPAKRSLTLHDLASFGVPGLAQVRIQGHAAVPREGPVLLLANRCSLLDSWLVGMAAGRPVHMGATSPLFWLPGLGELAQRINLVPISPAELARSGGADQFARALDRGHAVAVFADLMLEPRDEGPRYTVAPAFLNILLATMSEGIPVVPMLALGQGRRIELQRNPLLRPLLNAGSRVIDPQTPAVVYSETALRIGHAVPWRDGRTDGTLQSFRAEVEDSLGALF